MMWILGVGLILIVSILLVIVWPELGNIPEGEHAKKIAMSPNFDNESGRFVNRRQAEYDKMVDNFDMVALLKKQIFGKEQRAPLQQLPQIKPNIAQFARAKNLVYHWLGHSTILLRLDAVTILLDPVFGNAAPVPWAVRRFQKPVLSLEELPEIDLILISHDHYDHLNRESIQFFLDKETKFVVPLGISSHLMAWGIPADRITELDWWQETSFEGLQLACTPSMHFSGRLGPRGNTTLWSSWVVIGEKERFYFSGDSGYDTHFQQIGEKYGPFDVSFMEAGQYNPIWPMSHMFPEETVKAAADVGAKKMQPIHWGMFTLSTHDWFEPVEQVLQAGAKMELTVLTPKIGEEVQPNQPPEQGRWWKETLSDPK